MSPADRLRNDPRLLDVIEAYKLERKKWAGTITEAETSRLADHYAAKQDDAMRRNTVPDSPESIAALRDPASVPHDHRRHVMAGGLIDWTEERGWHRTLLGDRVVDLMDRDAAT